MELLGSNLFRAAGVFESSLSELVSEPVVILGRSVAVSK